MKDIFRSMLEQGGKGAELVDNDYYDEQGFLCCGNCKTRRQLDLSIPEVFGNEIWRVTTLCNCRLERQNEIAEEMRVKNKENHLQALIKDGVKDARFKDFRFEVDDGRNGSNTEVCRRYVSAWAEMKKENIGIILHGGVGSGKSFLAGCIANALLEQLVPVHVTTIPRALNAISEDFEGRQDYIDDMDRFDLLVLDDLGAERQTAYVLEHMFNLIDTRLRCGKPLIVTTNLTPEQMKRTEGVEQQRIYDRILEMCPIGLKLGGTSGREKSADARRKKAREILGGAK